MDVPQEGVSHEHTNPSLASVNTTLNPYASEYVPFSHEASSRGSKHNAGDHHMELYESSTDGPRKRAVFRSGDDEWNDELPDDIFPDFHSTHGNGDDDGASLPGLSVHGHCGNPRTSLARENDWKELYSDYSDNARWGDECGGAREYLTSQFPGFAAESVMGVYLSNNCDLHLTIEMLTQLEIQVEADSDESTRPKIERTVDLNAMEFPALPVCDVPVPSASFVSRGRQSLDFAAVAKRAASIRRESCACKQNGPAGGGPSGGAAHDKRNGVDGSASVWLETGEAVANLYGEMREEARDLARLRNAYFEQARQAYLVGNKGLAKELSVKGQMYNARMKAAHEKAREAIFRRRNPSSSLSRDSGGGMMIDLHGLHAGEAVRVLRHELAILRAEKRKVVVRICVGTGHHTKGSKTPSRLPIAVQRYLIEEEALHFTEPQPGLLQLLL